MNISQSLITPVINYLRGLKLFLQGLLNKILDKQVEILDELTELKETVGLQADTISQLNTAIFAQAEILKDIQQKVTPPIPGPPVEITLTAGIPFED